jgi:hypothetical protein
MNNLEFDIAILKTAKVSDFVKILKSEAFNVRDASGVSLRQSVDLVIEKFGDLIDESDENLSQAEINQLVCVTTSWIKNNILSENNNQLDRRHRVTDFIFLSLLPRAKGSACDVVGELAMKWFRTHIVDEFESRKTSLMISSAGTTSEEEGKTRVALNLQKIMQDLIPPAVISSLLQKILEVEFDPDRTNKILAGLLLICFWDLGNCGWQVREMMAENEEIAAAFARLLENPKTKKSKENVLRKLSQGCAELWREKYLEKYPILFEK